MSPPVAEAAASPAEIRARAIAGVLAVGIRGIALRGLGLLGNVVLARLLTPHDFGLVAFGVAVVAFGTFLSSGGFAAALIRQSERPSARQLEAVVGLQLTISLVLTVIAAACAPIFGKAGAVTVVIALSLPIDAIRTVPSVMLERELDYQPLVRIEVSETAAQYGAAIAAVALGAGVWGLAGGFVVRAAAGCALLLLRSGWIRPRVDSREWRGVFSFGALYSSAGIVTLVRDQGINVITAGIAGISAVGIWSMALRLVQTVMLFFSTLWRVAFPAMARLVEAGDDPAPALSRGLRLASVGSGLILAPLAATAPALMVVVFGAQWASAGDIVPVAAVGLLIAGPISTCAAGYLYATGRPRVVLRGLILHTAAWWAVVAALLRPVGVVAIGVGWFVSCLVEAAVLGRGLAAAAKIRVLSEIMPSVVAATAAGAAGWFLQRVPSDDLARLVTGGASALIIYVVTTALTRRADLLALLSIARRALPARSDRGAIDNVARDVI